MIPPSCFDANGKIVIIWGHSPMKEHWYDMFEPCMSRPVDSTVPSAAKDLVGKIGIEPIVRWLIRRLL